MALFDFLRPQKIPTSNVDYSKYFGLASENSPDYEIFSPGDISIPSGSISICDPLAYIWRAEPLERKIPAGSYPVKILIFKNSLMSERYAFALLELGQGDVDRWELAITSAQRKELSKLKKDEFFGFPVDAGMGCFVDSEIQKKAIEYLDEFLTKNDGANIYDDLFALMFKANAKNPSDPNDVGDWLNYTVPGTTSNIVMFQSGFGDGLYPAYWGLKKNGEVVSLVIDFLVIESKA